MKPTKILDEFVKMLPRWLIYRCAIRLIVHATTGKYSHQIVPELTAVDALARWKR